MKSIVLSAAAICFLMANVFAQQKGYYRTPSISKDMVIFSAEGDLWKWDMSKNQASRLTTNPGIESNPVISPDGKQVVFTGEYEGYSELYLMSTSGSVPKRLSFDLDPRITKPIGWTNDGKILYLSRTYNKLPDPQMLKLDPVTLATEQVPLAQTSDGVFDNSNTLFFSRLPKQGSNNKRYVGGYIQQIWKFDGKQEAKCLTADFAGTSYDPMLYKDRIYFLSDRDGSMNIWSMDKEGKSLKQHTFSKEWDLKSASIYGSQIVYQRGADLWIYDIETNKATMADISLVSDFDQRKPRWYKNPVESVSFACISPEGNYAAIISRGRLFVAPAKSERWVEVNRKSGIRYKEVQFINEKTLIYLSDESGEFEIWKVKSDGSAAPQQVTKNSKVLINSLLPSPDGKYVAYADKNEFLRIVDVNSGAVKFEYEDKDYGLNDKDWSANSQYLSFSHGIDNFSVQMNVVEIATGKSTVVTSPRLDSYSPAWTADNQWLYFLSDRNLQTKVRAPWGPRQPEPHYSEYTGIYAIPVNAKNKFPFLPKDPWSTDTAAKPPAVPAPATKGAKTTAPLPLAKPVNWEEAALQLYQVPVKTGNFRDLSVAEGFIYWLDNGPENSGPRKLFALKIESNKKNEPIEIATGVNGYQLSANKKKLLLMRRGAIAIADANGAKIDFDKSKIDLANWSFQVDPVEDWKQMFADAWRMMRDYFYDRDMHKVDWMAVRKQHEALLDRVTDRTELDDLIAQMISELSVLHAFVSGADRRKSPDDIQTACLGAVLAPDVKGLKITHIYKSDPDYPEESSPLAKPELDIKEGDIITAINDIPIKSKAELAELLANKVGVPVKLSLLNKSSIAYSQIINPISAGTQTDMRYSEWELSKREQVDKSSKDQIGYIHLRAMTAGDMDDFVKQYYPVFNRQGLIIDVRHNNGGNIDSWILEKLMRKAWFYWQSRAGKPYWNMQYAFRGHMVVICDQNTASDGEAFAEGFKRLGLGKVVGMRTWGGEVWLSSSNRLVDNGVASAPENGVYGPEGQWLIEGHGVEPDFVVDNLPFETFNGKDAQLEFAIDYLKKEIEKKPMPIPNAPVHPDKSFKYKKQEGQ